MSNLYFELTREFNAAGVVAVLSSGQAVVFYRLAIMSKEGDWIVREDAGACARIREVLCWHGACYRGGAPLDIDWLAGGWSSHFEFADARGAHIRCDFVSRPPRIPKAAVAALFQRDWGQELPVVDLPSLIATKQTQRAKDFPIVGALARQLPPTEELRHTTDPDRVLKGMTMAELEAARDLWFELAQTTNDSDPEYTHGVFQTVDMAALRREVEREKLAARPPGDAWPGRP